jgi:tRNA-dihydrouridine synthase B
MDTSKISPKFWVGNIPIYGDLILAPMDGVTDMPFRAMARELGSAMSYTGFVNAIDIVRGPQGKAVRQNSLEDGEYHAPSNSTWLGVNSALAYDPAERPVGFQLFDDDPERLLRAALIVRERDPDIIDINMGCSAKTVAGRGAGAGLLVEPGKIARIFAGISKALDIPVTGKIRLGWDDESRNYLEVAHIIEDNGGQLIAVHGRTKKQGYTGQADWDAIAEVKAAVKIPVIGNGDVRTVADIRAIKERTGVDAVMIGRVAMENPWLFQRMDRDQVPAEMVYSTIEDHLARSLEFYGEKSGMVLFRKFATRYLRPWALEKDVRERLLTCEDPREFLGMVRGILIAGGKMGGTGLEPATSSV